MTWQIRPARAGDAAQAVPLIHASGPAAFDYVFARGDSDAQAFLQAAFVDGAGEFGYRNHVVGELDGEVVAVGSGFTHAQAARFTLPAARQIVRHFGLAAAGPIVRGLRVERIIRPPRHDEFYIGHLGVAPACRGHGHGSKLLECLLEQARAQDCQHAVLDVADDNPRAAQLYARLGFVEQYERSADLANCHGAAPNQHRMRLRL